ncbi:trypsin-like peptidase domain-containing protein [bacterium]|nr:trypsin-like peptidase domain-containing protein [bacterium]
MGVRIFTSVRIIVAWAFLLSILGCGPSSSRTAIPQSEVGSEQKMSPAGAIDGVCFLKASRKYAAILDQTAISTGVLLDGRYVLTAGHNLFNASYPWGRIEVIGILVGEPDVSEVGPDYLDALVSGGRVEQGMIPVDGVWTVAPRFQWSPSTWLKPSASNRMIQHDYGFIDLGKSFSGKTSFTLSVSAGMSLKVGDVVRVAGYPGDSKRIKGATGERLYRAEGRITAIKANLFRYNIITAKGVSGAPVWVERDGKKIVVGVHVGSDFGGEKGAVARTVDSALIRDWNRWKSRRQAAD